MEGRNYADRLVTVTTDWETVATRKSTRDELMLYNAGSTTIYFGLSESTILRLEPGILCSMSPAPHNAVGAKVLSGTANLVIWEA